MRNIFSVFVLLLLCNICLPLINNLQAAEVDYARDIKPMLIEKCSSCHGALAQEADLRLDAGVLIHQGGESGKVIDLEHVTESLLLERVTTDDVDLRMPPEGEGEPLKKKQIELLKAWIAAGAKTPKDELIPAQPKDHWAYQPIVRPAVPEISSTEINNPIDAFIKLKHQQTGLQTAPSADQHLLVRRLYLDLIGIPPTREQIVQFDQQASEAAYSQLADQLLASPQYGERWGRHWMDVWRYSDWDGYKQQLRGSQRHIWRWRDWIIESINADKGYNQMVLEMLAADELMPEDYDAIRATGYLARNYHKSNRDIWLDATVEHTAKAFLGMTINCAKCHDHKFDPIAQQKYYELRAIFEPHNVRTERVPGQANLTLDGLPRAYDAELDVETYLYMQGNEKHPDKENPVSPAVPALFDDSFKVTPVQLPAVAVFPSLQPHIEKEQLAVLAKQLTQKQNALKKLGESADTKQATLQMEVAQLKLHSSKSRWVADKAKYADAAKEELEKLAKLAATEEREFNHQQAQLDQMLKQAALDTAEKVEVTQLAEDADDAVKKKVKAENDKRQAAIDKAKKDLKAAVDQLAKTEKARKLTDGKYTSVGTAYPKTSTGRRLAFARWVIDPKNPLTARVAVNHIWMRHFGEPLVTNVFDFGLRSPKPEYAELLDWLAAELIEHNWSMKHIHRLIVNSQAYQLASSMNPKTTKANQSIDPDNRLIWKVNARRLDAEVIRDSILSASGSLDLTAGGPDIDFNEGETNARRSVYFRHAYEKQMKMLVLFDTAGPNECYRRSPSIIPQQALALANSPLTLSQARKLSQQLSEEFPGSDTSADSQFIEAAFQQLLTRKPSEAELAACHKFLSTQATTLADATKLTSFNGNTKAQVEPAADPKLRARENLVHVLIHHNDFVTVR
ncbi:MAG: hypothetical protein COA78_30910 [Blastopirellula sp.]|nr:MAG: hypothetical protein COA78_30910 [Blastopirellula sp.]